MVELPGDPSHWTYIVGSVNARKTSSRGASNSRMMKNSCLPGSATIFVSFVVIVVLLLPAFPLSLVSLSQLRVFYLMSQNAHSTSDAFVEPILQIVRASVD